jgi:hypothetical protein
MEGFSDPRVSSDNDKFMNSVHIFTRVTNLTRSKNRENDNNEKDDFLKILNNFSSSFIQLKKLSQENENFRSYLAELNAKAVEDKSCNMDMINDEEKINEMQIDIVSESGFININEVGQTNYDEFIYNKEIEVNVEGDKEKSLLETSPTENKENKEDVNKNNIPKKKCLSCGLKNARKGRNTCIKCPRIKKIKDKCDCNENYFSKGMCRTCYDRKRWSNLPKPDKMCIKCNSKRAMKAGKICWRCYYVANKKKPFNCNCDKPHYAKGLCRCCYDKMKISKKIQIKKNQVAQYNEKENI